MLGGFLQKERVNSHLPPGVIDNFRRRVLGALGASFTLILPGCCSQLASPSPEIGEEELVPSGRHAAFLAQNRINKGLSEQIFCVDVHAHFFNASDVTVKGYLDGPVAHSVGGVVGRLLKLLAPLAEELAALAPSAKAEYVYLKALSSQVSVRSAESMERLLESEINSHRRAQSKQFYELLKTPRGRPFVDEYNRIRREVVITGERIQRDPVVPLDEMSLAKAMELGEVPRSAVKIQQSSPGGVGDYAEGSLAFIGYMLSYRWANLRTYRNAFSTHDEAIGVDRVLGSLVDFDRWLDCSPRSAHEDQMRLHALISQLSGGYMLPLISYNPWTDVVENGRSLRLVEQAVEEYGFVGVKIYPANGFRPWGNTLDQGGIGLPPPQDINKALEAFWDKCIKLGIPVMAHTGQSMGKDDAHDALGGPEGWEALIATYAAKGKSPLVNLGHFGGDTEGVVNDWTIRMAHLMAKEHADRVFGDLGYWSELQCDVVGSARCKKAADRLKSVLNIAITNNERVADRVMFGSDWLMLSRAPHWSEYPSGLFSAIKEIAPDDIENIFGKNALKCFGSRVATG